MGDIAGPILAQDPHNLCHLLWDHDCHSGHFWVPLPAQNPAIYAIYYENLGFMADIAGSILAQDPHNLCHLLWHPWIPWIWTKSHGNPAIYAIYYGLLTALNTGGE